MLSGFSPALGIGSLLRPAPFPAPVPPRSSLHFQKWSPQWEHPQWEHPQWERPQWERPQRPTHRPRVCGLGTVLAACILKASGPNFRNYPLNSSLIPKFIFNAICSFLPFIFLPSRVGRAGHSPSPHVPGGIALDRIRAGNSGCVRVFGAEKSHSGSSIHGLSLSGLPQPLSRGLRCKGGLPHRPHQAWFLTSDAVEKRDFTALQPPRIPASAPLAFAK